MAVGVFQWVLQISDLETIQFGKDFAAGKLQFRIAFATHRSLMNSSDPNFHKEDIWKKFHRSVCVILAFQVISTVEHLN